MDPNRRSEWKEIGRGWLEHAGPHVSAEALEAYAEGNGSADERARIKRHLGWCAVCTGYVRECQAEQPAKVYTFVPRRLRTLGWESAPSRVGAMAAGHEGPTRHETLIDRDITIDEHMSQAEHLSVTVSRDGEPMVGWVVQLQRIDAEGRVVSDERVETTDVRGVAAFGDVRALAPLGTEERFRIAAVAPGE